MGWTYQPKPANVKAYIKDKLLTWEGNTHYVKCLDVMIVQMKTAYAAIEAGRIENGQKIPDRVFGEVVLLDYRKNDYYDFGYKDMEETMGPVEARCPEKILDLLSPTENAYATAWRNRCREYHAERKLNKAKRKLGTYLEPKAGSVTLDGREIRLFKVVQWAPRKLAIVVADSAPPKLYRLTESFLLGLKAVDRPESATL